MPEIAPRDGDGEDGAGGIAPSSSSSGAGSGAADGYHPAGFDSPAVHGAPALEQQDDCRACHGEALDGGSAAVSCDGCHEPGWRTRCTYCHGGTESDTGAPPRDAFDHAAPSFAAHTAHVIEDGHVAFACDACHRTPTDVLSPGHVFVDDDTPGVAEVSFVAGLSSAGAYDGSGGCASLYCHGNGRGDNGVMTDGTTALGCDGCHPGPGGGGYDAMSGDHARHLGNGMICDDCHGDTVQGSSIIGASLHVDGVVEFVPDGGVTFNGGQCSGTCHGHGHSDSW